MRGAMVELIVFPSRKLAGKTIGVFAAGSAVVVFARGTIGNVIIMAAIIDLDTGIPIGGSGDIVGIIKPACLENNTTAWRIFDGDVGNVPIAAINFYAPTAGCHARTVKRATGKVNFRA